MKTGLLLSAAEVVVGVAVGGMVGGAADVRAACVPIADCVTLGYKYTATECPNGIACPFDTTKFFCFEPQICNYTITVATCSSQCKNVGSKSCIKNGVTYYESCGTSMCSSGKSCYNGTCYTPVAKSGYCCGYSVCNYNGTSHINDNACQSYFGRSCYEQCRHNGYPDCTDMQASCRASGGSPVFQTCDRYYYVTSDGNAFFKCK